MAEIKIFNGQGNEENIICSVETSKKIIELLNKNTHSKPVNRGGYPEGNRDTCDGQCPNCMSFVRNITPRSKKVNYCQDCGQAIDWE